MPKAARATHHHHSPNPMSSTLPRNEVRRESAFTSVRTWSLSLSLSLSLTLLSAVLQCQLLYVSERERKREREEGKGRESTLVACYVPLARYVTLSSYVIALWGEIIHSTFRIFELPSASACFRTRLFLSVTFLCFVVSLTKFLCFVYANYVYVLCLSFSGYWAWLWLWLWLWLLGLSVFLRHFSAHTLAASLMPCVASNLWKL